MRYEGSKPVLAKEREEYTKKLGEEKELQYNEEMMANHSEVYPDIDFDKLKEELFSILENEELAVKICDVLPVNKETIKLIVIGFDVEVDEEKIDKVHEILKKYLS